MYDNEKVLKASDQRDIIWLLFEETLAKVLRACKKNFLFYWSNRCFTGRSCLKADQRLTRVYFSFVKKTFLWIIFSVIFKSVHTALSERNLSFFRARGKRPALSEMIMKFNLATPSNGFVGCNGWSGVFVLKPIE